MKSRSPSSVRTPRDVKGGWMSGNWLYLFLIVIFIVAVVLLGFTKSFEYFSEGTTLEYFYMTTCGHCKSFSSTWEDAVEEIKKQKINIKTVKYDINGDGKTRAEQFTISAVPTVMLVKNGKPTEYSGPRTVEGLVAFAKSSV